MRAALLLALAIAGCGAGASVDGQGGDGDDAISRATDEAMAWVDALPVCGPEDGDRRGLLDPHGSACTRLDCGAARCCNRCALREVELFGAGQAVRVELPERLSPPALRSGGELLDCEWVAWRAVLRRARLRVGGSMAEDRRGAYLRVDTLCRQ